MSGTENSILRICFVLLDFSRQRWRSQALCLPNLSHLTKLRQWRRSRVFHSGRQPGDYIVNP